MSPAATMTDELASLHRALTPGAVAPYLEAAFPSSAATGRAPRILDVRYEPGVRCLILYALGDALLVGTLRWDGDLRSGDEGRWIDELGMGVVAFPHDRAMPGLAAALEPGALRRLLEEALPECRDGLVRVVGARADVLRYRPGRRCTLRVVARLRDGGGTSARTLYAKIYHDPDKAASVFEDMNVLRAGLEGTACSVARPAGYLPHLGMILQEPVDGAPLDALLRHGAAHGRAAVRRAAAGLAALHSAGLTSRRVRPIHTQLDKLVGRGCALEAVAPDLGRPLREVAETLVASLPDLARWDPATALAHGDCKPSQFLAGDGSVGLLDFDHCGMTDPASDVGNFIATLRQLALRHELKARSLRRFPGRAGSLRALEGEFLHAYASAAGASAGLACRARWYEAVSLTRKAYRSFQRSLRSPLPHALLEQARVCLAASLAPHSGEGRQGEGMSEGQLWRR